MPPRSKLSSAVNPKPKQPLGSGLKPYIKSIERTVDRTILADRAGSRREIELSTLSSDGSRHRLVVEPAALRNPRQILDRIANESDLFALDPKAVAQQVTSLQHISATKSMSVTSRTGWHDVNGKECFVTPQYSVPASSRVKLDSSSTSDHVISAVGQCKGSLKGWRKKVQPILGQSSFGIAFIAANYAATLLRSSPLTEDFCIMLVGESSIGKTSIQKGAQSVSGRAGQEFISSPDQSGRGFDETAVSHNDMVYPIEDIGRAASAEKSGFVKRLTYQATGGGGRRIAHSARSQFGLPLLQYRTITTVTSNQTFENLTFDLPRRRVPADAVRLLQLEVLEGDVFDMRSPSEGRDGTSLVADLQSGYLAHYGWPMRRWLEWLVAQSPQIRRSKVAQYLNEFKKSLANSPSSGYEVRVADKVGLLYAALIMAKEAKVCGWSKQRIKTGLNKVFVASLSQVRPEAIGKLYDALEALLANESLSPEKSTLPRRDRNVDFSYPALKGLSENGVSFIGLHPANLKATLGPQRAESLISSLIAGGHVKDQKTSKRYQFRVQGYGKPRLLQLASAFSSQGNRPYPEELTPL